MQLSQGKEPWVNHQGELATAQVTLEILSHLLEPQFLHLENGANTAMLGN